MQSTGKSVIMPRRVASKATAQTETSGIDKDVDIPNSSRTLRSRSVRDLRGNGKIIEAIRELAVTDGTVSAAVFAWVQVANSGYSIKAYNSADGSFSPIGTGAAERIRTHMDTLTDYSKGYSDKNTFSDIIETGLRECVLTSAVSAELVLNKARLPDKINIIKYESLSYKSDGKGGKYPYQTDGDVGLNIPNFWVAESHLGADSVYARPMLEAALNTIFYYLEFIEDMRRAVRRSGHTRIVVKLNYDKVVQSADNEVASDPDKLKSYLDATLSGVTTVINALEPEDALVVYDLSEVDSIDSNGDKQDYKELLEALSGLLATSLKSHPSILGLRMTGSQSPSNTETLVFLKTARAIQKPVEKILSRALTLAVRLNGIDAFVKFRFKPIDIRPE